MNVTSLLYYNFEKTNEQKPAILKQKDAISRYYTYEIYYHLFMINWPEKRTTHCRKNSFISDAVRLWNTLSVASNRSQI